MLPQLRYFAGRNYVQMGYKSYSVLLILMVGASSICRKVGILEKGGVVLEKGGMTPLTNYDEIPSIYLQVMCKCTLKSHFVK